jgi:hypothetical protein
MTALDAPAAAGPAVRITAEAPPDTFVPASSVAAEQLEQWGVTQAQFDAFNAPSFAMSAVPEAAPPPPIA